MPVLSEQITVTEPSVSTAGSFRISALRRSIRCAPIASVKVTTAGRPSGITATATLMAVSARSERGLASQRAHRNDERGDGDPGESELLADAIEPHLQRR